MARLLAVNVGLPRDVAWRGRTVRTGIWKTSVTGRRRVATLNVEGDGQGDLAGHGGEQRAVLVYQVGSYRHWQERLRRDDFVHGQFGENFTVDGLADDEVRIGDRYRIGSALFEVTQPRTTCYRVGIRMDEPRMASLLTASGRPGFYFRVVEEGDVAAGDPIVRVARGPDGMTVAVVNALLYSDRHPHDLLLRASTIPALSPGWRDSFRSLLESRDKDLQATGNAGLTSTSIAPAAKPGFRPLRFARIAHESADVVSFVLQPTDRAPLAIAMPGQFVVLRLRTSANGAPVYRSYSLSGAPSHAQYRISVKLEPDGVAGRYLAADVRVGDVVDASEPRGDFVLRPGNGPVVLLAAGIGATPVLAMLHALVTTTPSRDVWWLQAARDGASRSFATETRTLLAGLVHACSRVWFSRPLATDREGVEYDERGRIGVDGLQRLGVPRDADYYLCGPTSFVDELTAALGAWGADPARVHSERFGGGLAFAPGVVPTTSRPPHPPQDAVDAGPSVSFARSGINARLRPVDQSLLDLAEACDVPVRWSCRSGVCHQCQTGLISGTVSYAPQPLDPPSAGTVLICCACPTGDIVLDL